MNPPSAAAPVWFPQWKAELGRLRLSDAARQQYVQALFGYLRFCRESRQRATVPSARAFMAGLEAQQRLDTSQAATWRDALNWFFAEGRKRSAAPPPSAKVMNDIPSLAAADLGKTEWERRMIQVLRTRHYQWRTEQTYRAWAGRFAQWLEGRGQRVEDAGPEQVRGFLSDLATRRRVSASTQKQALHPVR